MARAMICWNVLEVVQNHLKLMDENPTLGDVVNIRQYE